MKQKQSYTVTAVDIINPIQDRVAITFVMESEWHNFNPIAAIRGAAKEFLSTDEGEMALFETAGSFNYGDFANYVPDEIMKRHGFKMLEIHASSIVVNHDESLIPDNL